MPSVLEASRLFHWEDLSETTRARLLGDGVGRRTDAVLVECFEPLTIIRLITRTGEVLLLEIMDPDKKLAVTRFWDERQVLNLGLCQPPSLLEVGERVYIQYVDEFNCSRTLGCRPVLSIEILDYRLR